MRKSILATIEAVRSFVPVMQLKTLVSGLRGEERGYFRQALRDLEKTIESMPVTYGQDGLGDDAVVHLHYFFGGCDWWITEKDMGAPGEGMEQRQAFGLVDLGHGPELGYISILELIKARGMDIDLHWKPQTLAQVKAKKYGIKPARSEPVKAEPVAYTVAQVVNVKDWFADLPAGLVH